MSAALLGMALKAKLHSKTRKMVLIKLVDCCHEDGTHIYPSLATIAEDAECSVPTARRVMQTFVQVGLLRMVKEGGSGAKSTNHYEMDIDMLARLRRPEMWPAMAAAAAHQPLPDADDEDDAAHASDAGQKRPVATPIKGITMEGYHSDSLPNQGEGYHQGDTQPLSKTPYSEREGARERESTPASEGEPERRPTASLDDFRKAYPHAGADDQAALASAWEGVPFTERWAAIEGIPGFVAERKAAGFTSRLSGPKYLSGFNWRHVPKQAAERAGKQSAGAFSEVKGWSREWWLMLHHRIAEGARQRISFMLQMADGGKSISVSAGDLAAAAARIGELKPFLCRGREIDAWRLWLAERGARIPVFAENSTFRVFLPSETPPRDPRDDDNVPL